MKSASDLTFNEKGIISQIDCTHPSARRILEIGFTPGQEIELISKSVFNDPIAFAIRGTVIAIRKNEAECIKIL
jgi:ferrous iron transport protein A